LPLEGVPDFTCLMKKYVPSGTAHCTAKPFVSAIPDSITTRKAKSIDIPMFLIFIRPPLL